MQLWIQKLSLPIVHKEDFHTILYIWKFNGNSTYEMKFVICNSAYKVINCNVACKKVSRAIVDQEICTTVHTKKFQL